MYWPHAIKYQGVDPADNRPPLDSTPDGTPRATYPAGWVPGWQQFYNDRANLRPNLAMAGVPANQWPAANNAMDMSFGQVVTRQQFLKAIGPHGAIMVTTTGTAPGLNYKQSWAVTEMRTK